MWRDDMNENQPNTDISGIQSQAEELIKAAFNKGLKQGRYEMHLQNSAHKEEFQRVYEEAEKLRADNAYIAKKFANYLINTTGGKASNPYADEDDIQQCFCKAFESEVKRRVKTEEKNNLDETLLALSDKLDATTKELEEARSRNEQLEARLEKMISAYFELLKEKAKENIGEKAGNSLKHGDPIKTCETWCDWIKVNMDKPVPDIFSLYAK
jgi:hypothetical protein